MFKVPTIYGRDFLIDTLQNSSGHDKKGIEGELLVLNYLERMMPNNATIIAKPEIGNLEPDFIVIFPKEALFIVEVKNLSLHSITEVMSNGVVKLKTGTMTNPFSQVSSHVEHLNQFIMSNYNQDIYKTIGKLVVFSNFTRSDFVGKFGMQLANWTEEHLKQFYRYHIFLDELETDFLYKLRAARKFPDAPFQLKGERLLEVIELMKPRPKAESSIEILHQEQLVDEHFFSNVFSRLIQNDKLHGQKIAGSIQHTLRKELPYVQGAKTYEQGYLALRNLMVAVKAESSNYLNHMNELNHIENKMLNERTRIVEQFKEDVHKGLHTYFQTQLKVMQYSISENTKWHTSLSDTSKKAAAFVYNPLLKMAKKTNALQDKVENFDELDGTSELEKILQQYLDNTKVESAYNQVMKKALHSFEENWKDVIKKYQPDLRGLHAFSSTIKVENQHVKYQFGDSEQILGVTVGAAVVGTIGLAAGWHTFAYAALNVFPPIAIFAAVATVATAVWRKDSEVAKRKEQLSEAVNSYKQHLFQQIDPPRITGKADSVFQHIEKTSDTIVKAAITEWEKQLFGDLTTDDYQAVVQALLSYATLIDESLEDVVNKF